MLHSENNAFHAGSYSSSQTPTPSLPNSLANAHLAYVLADYVQWGEFLIKKEGRGVLVGHVKKNPKEAPGSCFVGVA